MGSMRPKGRFRVGTYQETAIGRSYVNDSTNCFHSKLIHLLKELTSGREASHFPPVTDQARDFAVASVEVQLGAGK